MPPALCYPPRGCNTPVSPGGTGGTPCPITGQSAPPSPTHGSAAAGRSVCNQCRSCVQPGPAPDQRVEKGRQELCGARAGGTEPRRAAASSTPAGTSAQVGGRRGSGDTGTHVPSLAVGDMTPHSHPASGSLSRGCWGHGAPDPSPGAGQGPSHRTLPWQRHVTTSSPPAPRSSGLCRQAEAATSSVG